MRNPFKNIPDCDVINCQEEMNAGIYWLIDLSMSMCPGCYEKMIKHFPKLKVEEKHGSI